jgi:hypothetical protein
MEAIYASAWSHPGIAWIANGLLLLVGLRKAPQQMRAFIAVWMVGICVDAWLTGALRPGTAYGQAIGIFFVIAGDLRYFALVERFTGGKLHHAIALAFLVPISQTVMMELWPGPFQGKRAIFLSYEAMFVVACLLIWNVRYAAKVSTLAPNVAIFLQRLTAFEVIQYVLWASADVLILNGQDWALLLRLVPNALYYGGFLWFVTLFSPR